MNYETAIELARQRMREIGKQPDEYHIEPVCIIGNKVEQRTGEIVIKAYNEYYYLVNYENYFGFTILSDTGYFNADDYTENTIQEFTGLIRIQIITVPSEGEAQIIPIKVIDFVKVTFH